MPTKHINTFENGINKDINVLMQPQGTYRDLHNGMLISYDGNHYVVETALGNTVSFTIPSRYSPPDGVKGNHSTWTLDIPPLPIGLISFIDKLVVFSTNDPINGGYGEIGTVVFDNTGNGTYTPLYNDVNLKFTKEHKIFGFTYPENDKIQRVYWTDNFNEIRVINTQDPLLINYVLPAGPLINGTTYMVVNGAIEYPVNSGQFYGPGLTNGNLVPATTLGGPAYVVADVGNNPTGQPIVVQYIDYHLLSFNPDHKIGSIDFVRSDLAGSVTGGAKMFFYRQGISRAGYVTSWSYGSFPINVSGQLQTNWKDQQGVGSNGIITSSTRAIQIQISNIDMAFDTIEIAVAEFDQKNNLLTDAKIIIKQTVTGATMNFTYFGNENISALSVNDLTIFPASIRTCKDLCTSKNYITIANLKERDEIDFDNTIVTIADTVYNTPADVNGNNANMRQGTPFNQATWAGTGGILPDGKYVVVGSGTITYNTVVYTTGQTFVGVNGVTTFGATGTASINACIVIQKYTNSLAQPVNKVIPILDDYWDYKGMAATQYLRQYWTNETYRFGILFYDLKGNPYFVRWVGDHQIWNISGANPPTGITQKGGLMKDYNPNFSLQINGLKFSNIQISADLASKVSGFSIVRAPRDRQYYAQGLVCSVVNNGAGKCHPVAQVTISGDAQGGPNGAVGGVYTWHSPDALCQSSVFNGAATGNKLEGENFLSPIDMIVPVAPSGTNQGFTKYYDNTLSPNFSYPFVQNISHYALINPSSGFAGISPGFDFENDFLQPFGSLNVATGGNTPIIKLQNSIQFNSVNLESIPSLQQKVLANYKISKGALYGGQGVDAIANTPFISTGHFQEINATVLANLPTVGAGPTLRYVFNNVEVYGGDSFVSIFDHAKALYNDNNANSYGYGVFFPVESSVNHSLREGRTLAKDGLQASSANGIYFLISAKSQLESFLANDAYISDGDVFKYPALPANFTITGNFPYRVRWAGPKISGEKYDTFRVFLLNNFRDLDGHRGQINNVASKAGKLYFWQDHGIGYLPILERQVVGGALGEATQLGVGGVIDRFDEFNTYFGNQHQSSLVDTEYGYSWFDMRRRAWLIMNVGGGIEEISVAKGLQSFFMNAFPTTFTPSIIDTDKPLQGIGVHGVYDPQFKTTLLTFKNYQARFESTPYSNFDFTVGYNHVKNVIVGFFDFNPAIWQNHNHFLLSAKNTNGNIIFPMTTYNIGDEVKKNGIQYVCVTGFTTHALVQLYEQPDFAGSTLWTKMYSENEVYKHWTGDICKFYGRVYPFIQEVIINPPVGEAFTVDNLQVKSNPINSGTISTNFDTFVYSTDNDSAQDINLALGNRNYRWTDNAWFNNVALGAKGRLTDYYLRVRMTLNNFVSNPTISTNKQKVMEFIGSLFRVKK